MRLRRRRWQWTYRADPGWWIVLSCLRGGERSRRWETELSMPGQRVRLYYHRTRRAALANLRSMGITPRRET